MFGKVFEGPDSLFGKVFEGPDSVFGKVFGDEESKTQGVRIVLDPARLADLVAGKTINFKAGDHLTVAISTRK